MFQLQCCMSLICNVMCDTFSYTEKLRKELDRHLGYNPKVGLG